MKQVKERDYLKVWAVHCIGFNIGLLFVGPMGKLLAGMLYDLGVSLDVIKFCCAVQGGAIGVLMSYTLLRVGIPLFILRKLQAPERNESLATPTLGRPETVVEPGIQ